jgi:hypothetical protein
VYIDKGKNRKARRKKENYIDDMSMQKGFALIGLTRLAHALKIVELFSLLPTSFYRLIQIESNKAKNIELSFFSRKKRKRRKYIYIEGADSSLDKTPNHHSQNHSSFFSR